MYNKRKVQKVNDKKVLHKVKKHWVTISLALLMAIGGAGATRTKASANDNTNNGSARAERIARQHRLPQGNNYSPKYLAQRMMRLGADSGTSTSSTSVNASSSTNLSSKSIGSSNVNVSSSPISSSNQRADSTSGSQHISRGFGAEQLLTTPSNSTNTHSTPTSPQVFGSVASAAADASSTKADESSANNDSRTASTDSGSIGQIKNNISGLITSATEFRASISNLSMSIDSYSAGISELNSYLTIANSMASIARTNDTSISNEVSNITNDAINASNAATSASTASSISLNDDVNSASTDNKDASAIFNSTSLSDQMSLIKSAQSTANSVNNNAFSVMNSIDAMYIDSASYLTSFLASCVPAYVMNSKKQTEIKSMHDEITAMHTTDASNLVSSANAASSNAVIAMNSARAKVTQDSSNIGSIASIVNSLSAKGSLTSSDSVSYSNETSSLAIDEASSNSVYNLNSYDAGSDSMVATSASNAEASDVARDRENSATSYSSNSINNSIVSTDVLLVMQAQSIFDNLSNVLSTGTNQGDAFDAEIVLNNSNNKGPYAYVIQGKQGGSVTLTDGETFNNLKATSDGKISATDKAGNQVLLNYQLANHIISQKPIKSTTINPQISFYYVDGNDKTTLDTDYTHLNTGIDSTNPANSDGSINIPTNVSGYYGEPYPLIMNDFYNPNYGLYPNFSLGQGATDNDELGTVVLGEGQGNTGTDNFMNGSNDHGNYWYGARENHKSRRLNLYANRYFVKIAYTYGTNKYYVNAQPMDNDESPAQPADPYDYYTDQGHQVSFSNGVLAGVDGNSVIYNNQSQFNSANVPQGLGIGKPTVIPVFGKNGVKGTYNNPTEVDIPLVPVNQNIQAPVLLANYDHYQSTNNPNYDSSATGLYTPATVTFWNTQYNKDNNFQISRGALNYYDPAKDEPTYQSTDGTNFDNKFYEPNNNSVLNGYFLISEGNLKDQATITGQGVPGNQWDGLTRDQQFINGTGYSMIGAKQEWVDINSGHIVPTPTDPTKVTANIQQEMVPIIYYGTVKQGQYNDLTTAPNIFYNYRLWGPDKRDQTDIDTYYTNFVNPTIDNGNGIDRNNDDLNNNPENYARNYDNPQDYNKISEHNAHNIQTTQQNASYDIAHSLVPSGTIIQCLPYVNIDHFKGEDPNLPQNDWVVQIVKTSSNSNGEDSQGHGNVELRFLQVIPNSVKYSADGTPTIGLSTHQGAVTYLGLANGASNDVLTETPKVGDSGTPGYNVSYKNNRNITWYPQNAAVLADQDGNLCVYHNSEDSVTQNGNGNNIDDLNGYYTLSNGNSIQFDVVNTIASNDNNILRSDSSKPSYQAQEVTNGADGSGANFYLGDMNAYAQPVKYTVQFLGSQNYMTDDGKNITPGGNAFPSPTNNGANNNQFYPGYTTNTFTFDPTNRNTPNYYDNLGFANDEIYYNNIDGKFYLKRYGSNSDTPIATTPIYDASTTQPESSNPSQLFTAYADGTIYLDDSKGQPQTLLTNSSEYNADWNLAQPGLTKIQQVHQLLYDSGYEQSYLDSVRDTERNQGHEINSMTGPTWTLGIGNPQLNIWPDGTSLTDNDNGKDSTNEKAVVYLADKQIKAQSTIHFVDLDTGYQFSEGNSGSNAITQLFNDVQDNSSKTGNKSEFDIASFLKGISDERTSTLQSDGTWKLETQLQNGDNVDVYVVRTDSPSAIQPVNDTFIYVSTVDLGNPNVTGKYDFPLVVRYEDTDGNPIDSESASTSAQSSMEADAVSHYNSINSSKRTSLGVAMQGAHDFLVDGPVGNTVSDAINGKNTNDPSNTAYKTYYNQSGKTSNPFWDYTQEGYHEVYVIPGVYRTGDQDYSADRDHLNDDQHNLYISGTPVNLTNNGVIKKSVGEVGYTPVITIVLQRNPSVTPYYVCRDLNGQTHLTQLGSAVYVPGIPTSDASYSAHGYSNAYDQSDSSVGNIGVNVGSSANSMSANSEYNAELDNAFVSEIDGHTVKSGGTSISAGYKLPGTVNDDSYAEFNKFSYASSYYDQNNSNAKTNLIESNSQSINVNRDSGNNDPIYVTAPGIQIHYRLVNDQNLDGGNGSQSNVDLNTKSLYAPNPMPGTEFNTNGNASSTDETTLNYYKTLTHATGYIPRNYINDNYQVVAVTGIPMINSSVYDGDQLPTKFTYGSQNVYIYLQPKSHIEVHYIDAFNGKSLSDISDNDSLVAYNGSFGSMNTTTSSSAGASYINSTSGSYTAGELVYNPQITLQSLYSKGYRIDSGYVANYGNNSSEVNITTSAANSTYSLDYKFNQANEDSYNSTTSSYDQHHLIYNIYLTHSLISGQTRFATVDTKITYSMASNANYNFISPVAPGASDSSEVYIQSYTEDAVTHSDESEGAWSLSGQSISNSDVSPTVTGWHPDFSSIALPNIGSTSADLDSELNSTSGASFSAPAPNDNGTLSSGSTMSTYSSASDKFSIMTGEAYNYTYKVVYYPNSYSDKASAGDVINYHFLNSNGSEAFSSVNSSAESILNYTQTESWSSSANNPSYYVARGWSTTSSAWSWNSTWALSYISSGSVRYHLASNNAYDSSVLGVHHYKNDSSIATGADISKSLRANSETSFAQNLYYIPDSYSVAVNSTTATDTIYYRFYDGNGSLLTTSSSVETLHYSQSSSTDTNNPSGYIGWTSWSASGASAFSSIIQDSYKDYKLNGNTSATPFYSDAGSFGSVSGSSMTNDKLSVIDMNISSAGVIDGTTAYGSLFSSKNSYTNWVNYTEDQFASETQSVEVNEVFHYINGAGSDVSSSVSNGLVLYTRTNNIDKNNGANDSFVPWSLVSGDHFSNVPNSFSSSSMHVYASGYGDSATSGNSLVTSAPSSISASGISVANVANPANNAINTSAFSSTINNWIYYEPDSISNGTDCVSAQNTVQYLINGGPDSGKSLQSDSVDTLRFTRTDSYDTYSAGSLDHRIHSYGNWSAVSSANFASISAPLYLSSNGKYYHRVTPSYSLKSDGKDVSEFAASTIDSGGSATDALTSAYDAVNHNANATSSDDNSGVATYSSAVYYASDSYTRVSNSAYVNEFIHYQTSDGSDVATSASMGSIEYTQLGSQDSNNPSVSLLGSWSTTSAFSKAPSRASVFGYHITGSKMIPETSDYASNSLIADKTSTIDEYVYYQKDSVSSLSDSVEATNTVNYYIQGGSTSVSSSATDTIQFSRLDDYDAVTHTHSYGDWTSNVFNSDSAASDVSYSSGHYHLVTQNVAGLTPTVTSNELSSAYSSANSNVASDSISGSGKSGKISLSQDIYYASDVAIDFSSDGELTAHANITISYLSDGNHSSSVASTYRSAITYGRDQYQDKYSSSVYSYGAWTITNGSSFSEPGSPSVPLYHAVSSQLISSDLPTSLDSIKANNNYSYTEDVYYAQDSASSQTAKVSRNIEYIFSGQSNDGRSYDYSNSTSTQTVTYSRPGLYNPDTHSFTSSGAWSLSEGSFNIPASSSLSDGWHVASVESGFDTYPTGSALSELTSGENSSHTYVVSYAPDTFIHKTNTSSATATINYVELSNINWNSFTGDSKVISSASSTVTMYQSEDSDENNSSFNSYGSWVASGFSLPTSLSISDWTNVHGVANGGDYIPTSSFSVASNTSANYEMNVYYVQDPWISSSDITTATDTVNYLISGTTSALRSASTTSVTYRRSDSVNEVTNAHSTGSWSTDGKFASVSHPASLASYGHHYHEVSADVTLPSVSQSSLDQAYSGNSSATSYSNNVYYASDSTSNIRNTSSATATINYIEIQSNNDHLSRSIVSTKDLSISMSQSENIDHTYSKFDSYGSWVANGFSLPTSLSIDDWSTSSALNSGYIPTSSFAVASTENNSHASYVMDVYYIQDPSAQSSDVVTATDTVNYLISGTSSALSSASTRTITYSRADSEDLVTHVHSYGSWLGSQFGSISVPSSIIFNDIRYHEVSADSTVPSVTSSSLDAYCNGNHSATSYVNDIYYAPDVYPSPIIPSSSTSTSGRTPSSVSKKVSSSASRKANKAKPSNPKAPSSKKINRDIAHHRVTPTDAVHMNKHQLKTAKLIDPKQYPKVLHDRKVAQLQGIKEQLTHLQKTQLTTYNHVAQKANRIAKQLTQQPTNTQLYRDVLHRVALGASVNDMNYLAVHNSKVYKAVKEEQLRLGAESSMGQLSGSRMGQSRGHTANLTPSQRFAYAVQHNPRLARQMLEHSGQLKLGSRERARLAKKLPQTNEPIVHTSVWASVFAGLAAIMTELGHALGFKKRRK